MPSRDDGHAWLQNARGRESPVASGHSWFDSLSASKRVTPTSVLPLDSRYGKQDLDWGSVDLRDRIWPGYAIELPDALPARRAAHRALATIRRRIGWTHPLRPLPRTFLWPLV